MSPQTTSGSRQINLCNKWQNITKINYNEGSGKLSALLDKGDIMPTISEYVRSDSTLKVFAGLLEKGGYAALLDDSGPYTLFAPNDAAFERMNILKSLEDPKKLEATLKYHLVSGKVTSAEVCATGSIGTEYGTSLTIELEEDELVIDNAKFVTKDIECSNGIIHIIDNVFQPQLSGWYFHEKRRSHITARSVT